MSTDNDSLAPGDSGVIDAEVTVERIDQARRRGHARRISYFMLVRLAMVIAFTMVAGWFTWRDSGGLTGSYAWFVWGTIALGYGLTLLFAWLLPRMDDLDTFAWIQTATDILFSAVVVHMSGGVDSGFTFLYLMAILGAATMGDRRQTWAAAGACLLIYGVMGMLELGRVVVPLTPAGEAPLLPAVELWSNVGRTVAAMVGVMALSSFLNTQLASSVSQVGSLRALNENIVRSLQSGLITVDESRRVLYFNPAAAQILRLDERHLGVRISALLPGIEDVLDSGFDEPGGRWDLDISSPSGRRIHLGLSVAPLMNDIGQRIGAIVNFQDVTRMHELQEEVRRNERLAAIGGLAASVAHEVRNPLAAITGSAELLDETGLNPENRRLLTVVRRESTKLNLLVTDLLAFTRPRTPDRVALDVGRAVSQVCDAFVNDPANRGIELDMELQGDPPLVAEVDPPQLSQVLWNLLRNGAEAMSGTGRITVTVSRTAHDVRIAVTDNGPGIPAELHERIFEPFFTTKQRGTGFGLALAYRIVEDHQGSIRIDCPATGGTRLTVALPLAD